MNEEEHNGYQCGYHGVRRKLSEQESIAVGKDCNCRCNDCAFWKQVALNEIKADE